MPRSYFRPIKEETVISVLHYLRQVAVRDGLDTLPHVNALLAARGVEPEELEVPRKTPKAFRKGELRRLVLEALRDGPQTGAEIARKVQGQKPELTFKQTYKRVYICLNTLKGRGVVRLEKHLWIILDRI